MLYCTALQIREYEGEESAGRQMQVGLPLNSVRLYRLLLLCHTPEKLCIECVSREGENKLLCFPP